ncbi:ribonuclease HII [Aliifodinibius salicampi]|uniref:Ribonuclease HII n=1 Tax=Fodinibius salicampi TaxID=1920655 RepID=A0ABT3Q1U4_9BACT|nr:ribonuclease HII [Fodinibius salicampi]MCW9714079.1 ribonuclease HII [Fodinibius salicampi]
MAENKVQNIDRLQFERQLWSEGFDRVMGLDEVGRGCLAGPVVAGGVIFKPGTFVEEIRDSKTISLKERMSLTEKIKELASFWTVQWCMPAEIDELNILHASIKAMHRCTEAKKARPDYLLVDGNRFSAGLCPHKCLVKGDDRSMSIAAASIIAKVFRDKWMIELHKEYPYYGWDTNVGYPTAQHYSGLEEYGYTEYHRQSFKLRTDKEVMLEET